MEEKELFKKLLQHDDKWTVNNSKELDDTIECLLRLGYIKGPEEIYKDNHITYCVKRYFEIHCTRERQLMEVKIFEKGDRISIGLDKDWLNIMKTYASDYIISEKLAEFVSDEIRKEIDSSIINNILKDAGK